jgi:hypothetical protein
MPATSLTEADNPAGLQGDENIFVCGGAVPDGLALKPLLRTSAAAFYGTNTQNGDGIDLLASHGKTSLLLDVHCVEPSSQDQPIARYNNGSRLKSLSILQTPRR